MLGEPICVSTLSSHCRGPLRCSSIQQGVLVTVCRLGGTQREHRLSVSMEGVHVGYDRSSSETALKSGKEIKPIVFCSST